jgi:cell wall-associated NlpC family hydrolase
VWGAAGPTTFDCSGLVQWAFAQVGISLPHYSGAQFADGVQIPMSDLEPGDLVFFSDPGEHVAIYIGGGQIIEAPHTGAVVHIVPMYSDFTQAVRIS